MDYGTGDADSHHKQDTKANGNLLQPPKLYEAGGGHKRSLSGSILSRFSFFRSANDQLPEFRRETKHTVAILTPQENQAPKQSTKQNKNRKQKGSLRKKVLLGTENARTSGRNRSKTQVESPKRSHESGRRYSLSHHGKIYNHHEADGDDGDIDTNPASSGNATPKFISNNDDREAASSHEYGWPSVPTNNPVTRRAGNELNARIHQQTNGAIPPIKSPYSSVASQPYASTTDDDDGITISRTSLANIASAQKSSSSSSPSPANSYYNISSQPYSGVTPIPRRRVSHKIHSHPSPVTHSSIPQIEDEWDYSETEWWGWFVLLVTWIVFVVGMGSCFGVWSWAWDVGETPYAPPELEDDPTLPIVGYYPALIVMTFVMAWVWVVVAWVGMKYFRHAKVVRD